jgi:hypothetical protein
MWNQWQYQLMLAQQSSYHNLTGVLEDGHSTPATESFQSAAHSVLHKPTLAVAPDAPPKIWERLLTTLMSNNRHGAMSSFFKYLTVLLVFHCVPIDSTLASRSVFEFGSTTVISWRRSCLSQAKVHARFLFMSTIHNAFSPFLFLLNSSSVCCSSVTRLRRRVLCAPLFTGCCSSLCN